MLSTLLHCGFREKPNLFMVIVYQILPLPDVDWVGGKIFKFRSRVW